MKPIEQEILNIKTQHARMWELVESQIRKAFEALANFDKDLAKEIISREKRVNAQELVVDHQCENFIALFGPVAVDLRFVISLLKITNNLERIGDFAESIAHFVLKDQSSKLPNDLMDLLELKKMCKLVFDMFITARTALAKEDTGIASKVLSMDYDIDCINIAAVPVIGDYINSHPDKVLELLRLYGVIRRIERIGDRSANIAENIVFYIDAKELRHKQS